MGWFHIFLSKTRKYKKIIKLNKNFDLVLAAVQNGGKQVNHSRLDLGE